MKVDVLQVPQTFSFCHETIFNETIRGNRNLTGPERILNKAFKSTPIENMFGIMSARQTIDVVEAICALYNFVMRKLPSSRIYAPLGTFNQTTITGEIIE